MDNEYTETFQPFSVQKGVNDLNNIESAIEKLKEWVNRNYDSIKCGWTSQRSFGNFDDCFNDGYESGYSDAAYIVGEYLDMDLEEPEEPDYE